uniref:Uncharacterized protein n=1 Tax=Arundo donax TaxID=35708 RepID=A0A0A9C900_ARUDO
MRGRRHLHSVPRCPCLDSSGSTCAPPWLTRTPEEE